MNDQTGHTPRHTNRLAQETSPYLLQHQHNPVDWYPWGPEAFEAARAQDRPIFLSVGYSTCYWCHVMERQSFESESVAAEMNKRFICIKVDREERPDVDQLYMTAVQILTRRGGWPMSVWLTPDLRPIYGGTYYPPEQFVQILHGLEDAWKNRRGEILQAAEQITGYLLRLAEPPAPESPITVDNAFIEGLLDRTVADYDPVHGGFGGAPKFPRETELELLLVYNRHFPNDRRMQMVRHTLDALERGGIRDQLGGGFHRYSTDAEWLVPHFEIMLYDNAMLAWVYVEAFRQTSEPRYAAVARGIFDFVLREMTAPDGAFYTAFDAEVDAMEGLSYLWTREEVESLLGPEDAKLFNRVYGVDRGPNFADPHHGTGPPDKNILFLPEPPEKAAAAVGMDAAALQSRLEPMRQTLYQARLKRKQPLLDTKILTSWNALMIRAFAYGGEVLGDKRYLQAAAKAADFLLTRHRTPDGGLYRTSRNGQFKYNGFLDDYAFLVQALLALDQATHEVEWRKKAARLAIPMVQRFFDGDNGGFYFTAADATDLVVRQKTATDSPLPSGNAVGVMALLALGQFDAARQTLALFAQSLETNGEGMSSMIQAAMLYLQRQEPFRVSASGGEEEAPDRPTSPQALAATVVTPRATWVGPAEIRVQLDILDPFHINAHDVGVNLPLIATTLSVEGGGATVEYPPGEEQRFAFTESPIRVYSGIATLAVHFDAPQPEDSKPRMSLAYQACDKSACLPPVIKAVEW